MTYKDKTQDEGGWSFRFVLIMCISYLVIPCMSFSLACLNAPSEIIKDFMNETELERNGEPMAENDIESMFGLLVAVVGIGAAVGSLTSSTIADAIGRKFAILISTVTGIAGVLVMALCEVGSSSEMLFAGRVIVGLATGWGLSLAPTYVMEICLPHQKGAASMVNQLSQSTAIFVSQILGYEELLGNKDYWTYLLGFPLILLGLQLITFPFCPETPRYLLVKKEDEAAATKALRTIRGQKDVKSDIDQLREEMAQSSTDAQVSIVKLFTTPMLRRPLIIAIAMGLQQNWCGMNGILFFSASLFEDVGVEGKASRYATSGTGAVFVLGNIIATFLMPRFGRKTLFVAGTISMGVCSAVLSLTMIFKDDVDELKYVNIVVSLLVIASYALGPICVYWVILGELFPHSARGAGFSVAILCAFTGFFTHCYALPAMLDSIGNYTFFVFAGIDALMAVFCMIYMPETKNKSFADIAKSWATETEMEKDLPKRERSSSINMEIVIEAHDGSKYMFENLRNLSNGDLTKEDEPETNGNMTKM